MSILFGLAIIAGMIAVIIWGLRNPGATYYRSSRVPVSPKGLCAGLTFVLALGGCLVVTRFPYFRDSNRHSAWVVFPLMGVAVIAWVIGVRTEGRDKDDYRSERRREEERKLRDS